MTDKEKLKKIKELADAMYVKMQNLTTDTSGIRKAMEEYRQFIINEYNKEDPVSEELEEVSKKYSSCIYLEEVLSDDDKEVLKEKLINNFKAGAKWQQEKDESTTEDLGMYINELSKQFPEVSFAKLSRIAVRVAKWQKEQMQSSIVELAKNTQYREDLETKEVDFINEFHTFSEKHKLMDKDIEFSDIEKTASFFFQLGLKAKEEKRKYIGLVGGTFTTTTK